MGAWLVLHKARLTFTIPLSSAAISSRGGENGVPILYLKDWQSFPTPWKGIRREKWMLQNVTTNLQDKRYIMLWQTECYKCYTCYKHFRVKNERGRKIGGVCRVVSSSTILYHWTGWWANSFYQPTNITRHLQYTSFSDGIAEDGYVFRIKTEKPRRGNRPGSYPNYFLMKTIKELLAPYLNEYCVARYEQ